jgi:hypothetical protein
MTWIYLSIFILGWYFGVLTETWRSGKRCPHCERLLPDTEEKP